MQNLAVVRRFTDAAAGLRASLLSDLFSGTSLLAAKKAEIEIYANSRAFVEGLGYYRLDWKFKSLLPCSDENEFAYFKRINSLLSGREFFLVFNDFHLIAPHIASWAISAASISRLPDGRGLAPKVMGGNEGYDLSLIIGDYRVTPTGVHADPNWNYLFPLVGPKVIRGWDEEYVRGNPQLEGSLSYQDHSSNSILLSAEWGEYISWRPDFWHIAEGKSRFKSISVGLGVMSNP